MNKIAVILVNYNMPEAVHDTVQHFREYVQHPHDLIVVENGSDKHAPSAYASIVLEKNVQTTHGWLMGWRYAQALAYNSDTPYLAYWFITTSMRFTQEIDHVAMLADVFEAHADAYAVSPAWVGEFKAWTHRLLAWNGSDDVEEKIFPAAGCAHRARTFDAFGGFNPELTYSWGCDIDLALRAQSFGLSMYLHHGARVEITENIGYKLGRMDMNANDRKTKAFAQMDRYLTDAWPIEWPKVKRNEQIDIRLCD